MVRNNEGLTKTYNRFHDPNETSPDILKTPRIARGDGPGGARRLRLDRPEAAPASSCSTTKKRTKTRTVPSSKKKKPWRYRWPDEFRDEVLARLLELNKKRAEEEAISGLGLEKTLSPHQVGRSRDGRRNLSIRGPVIYLSLNASGSISGCFFGHGESPSRDMR